MTATLNHTIVWCRDQHVSAGYLAEVLGLGPPGGRGTYFLDPDGHVLEILTRPYGSDG